MLTRTHRRIGILVAFLLACGVATIARAEDKVFRVAWQKGAGVLLVLKERGTLERTLKPLGWSVAWSQFPAGPQLLESLNVGAADFGLVGEGPPIFAQAAGADIVYVGSEAPAPKTEAIIVPKDSSIRTIADMKGKRVALNKGSDVNYLLVRALEANGLAYTDVTPVYLAPADARAAFERGAVDAWVIWDPYYAATEIALQARMVADATDLAGNVSYYMATRQMAEGHRDVLVAVLAAIEDTDTWMKQNPDKLNGELTAAMGIPADVVDRWIRRTEFGARPVDAAMLVEQQKIADAFAKLHLIPRPINVSDAAWKPGS